MTDTAAELAARHAASRQGSLPAHLDILVNETGKIGMRVVHLEAELLQKKLELREMGQRLRHLENLNVSMVSLIKKTLKFDTVELTPFQRRVLHENRWDLYEP